MQVESYPALFSPCVAVISASSMASSVSYFSMRSNAFCMTVCLLSCLARSEAALLLAILFFKRLIWRAISKPRTILFSLSIGRFSSSCSSPFPSAQVSICFQSLRRSSSSLHSFFGYRLSFFWWYVLVGHIIMQTCI